MEPALRDMAWVSVAALEEKVICIPCNVHFSVCVWIGRHFLNTVNLSSVFLSLFLFSLQLITDPLQRSLQLVGFSTTLVVCSVWHRK